MAVDKHRMGLLHEEFLAAAVGGRRSKSSGAHWTDKADGRANHLTDEFAFAFDGKSTRGDSISITRAMLAKVREEADGERPMIGARFYDTDDLKEVSEEWVLITAADFAGMREAAVAREESHERITTLENELRRELSAIRSDQRAPVPAPPSVPAADLRSMQLNLPPQSLWPCMLIVINHHSPEKRDMMGYQIDEHGRVQTITVDQVRMEPTGSAEERLIVNGFRVPRGEVRIDGRLRLRVPSALAPPKQPPWSGTPEEEALRNAGGRPTHP
jgi:hypothetical protein